MKESISKKRCHERDGFSLAELLMTILVLLMVTSVVAAGVPVAVRAYWKVIDAANAQVLLSTTMTELRNELGTAVILSENNDEPAAKNGTTITYRDGLGYKTRIYSITEGDKPGIWVRRYLDASNSDTNYLLVSNHAANERLHVEYSGVSYNGTKNIIIFNELVVKKGSEKMTKPVDYSIRMYAAAVGANGGER